MHDTRYADLFRTEAHEHLAELDACVLAYERDHDDAHVATLFRSTHSMKGMAAAMGYRAVEQLAHALESLLHQLREGHVGRDAALLSLLFETVDTLRASVNDAVQGRGDDVSHVVSSLRARLVAQALSPDKVAVARIESRGPLVTDSKTNGESPVGGAPNVSIIVRLTADCPLKGVRALMVLTRCRGLGAVRHVSPSQETWTSEQFDGRFTVQLNSTVDAKTIETAVRATGDVDDVHVEPIAAASIVTSTTDVMQTIRVDRRRLDTLLDLVGELVITRDRLLRVAEEHDHGSSRVLTRTAHETARLISALQEEVMQARMVPVSQVFDRFPRLVRDIAQELGKDVGFVAEGREIELDRALLDAIGDPIVHLLRNALDHGIESPEVRRAAGKAPRGVLVLRAVRDRAAVVIQVEDDGNGIDRDAILRRAHALGVVSESVRSLDDDALLQVLAHAGFSTKASVSAISGRGVGVDVVATRVRALGGVLSLETLHGQGTVFTLRLPVSVAITRALIVTVNAASYAIPAAHVVEVLAYDAGMILTHREREALNLRDELVPLVHARDRFDQAHQLEDAYIVVVDVAGRRTAVVVDALVAQQDIVVKPFDAVRGSPPWFSGATVLGDGTPALIVDLGSLT